MIPKLIFENVVRIGEDTYLTSVSGWDLHKLWEGGVIVYNPVTQRGEKVVRDRKGREKIKPVFSYTNVKKIVEKVLRGEYHPDTIVINVLKDGEENIEYDEKEKTIYINEGEIDILDGQHRLRALDQAQKTIEKNDLPVDLKDLIFPLQICNLTVEDAQNSFHQFAQGVKISPTRSEYFDSKSYENLIVKHLFDKSDLGKKIEVVKNNIPPKERYKVVTFATLVNAIRISFGSIETKKQTEQLSKYLCEFFDELIDTILELRNADKRLESKEGSLIAENFTFYGYVAVAARLYGNKEWEKLVRRLADMDYYKKSDIWFGHVIKEGRAKKFSIINNNASRKYFVQKFVEEFEKVAELE
ncbi:MAG: DNA sulfur modification protein DndB [Acidaminococcaceae bacterium]|nr:DNA sulfur modification protein DndB [Acidaminococcaceae bacterium]